MKIVPIVASLFSISAVSAIAAPHIGSQQIAAPQYGSSQIQNSNVLLTIELPGLLSMGPDPGGHTGATVTPETTKTGQPAVDSARESASGGKTENSGPPNDQPQPPKKTYVEKP